MSGPTNGTARRPDLPQGDVRGRGRWFFTDQHLLNHTASRRDGMSYPDELMARYQCARGIRQLGESLKHPPQTIATAIIFMHRFYMYQSFKAFGVWPMTACCLFLASKVEETMSRMRDILVHCFRLRYNRERPPPAEDEEAYWLLREELLVNEHILLRTLGFDVHIEQPYYAIIKMGKMIRFTRPLAQEAWQLCSDSLRTTLPIQFRADELAVAFLIMAYKKQGVPLPPPTADGEFWHRMIKPAANARNVRASLDDIMRRITEFYQRKAQLAGPKSNPAASATATVSSPPRPGPSHHNGNEANRGEVANGTVPPANAPASAAASALVPTDSAPGSAPVPPVGTSTSSAPPPPSTSAPPPAAASAFNDTASLKRPASSSYPTTTTTIITTTTATTTDNPSSSPPSKRVRLDSFAPTTDETPVL